ncbi:hypothetical protein AAHE18_06G226300 [Arachis hypogaea]
MNNKQNSNFSQVTYLTRWLGLHRLETVLCVRWVSGWCWVRLARMVLGGGCSVLLLGATCEGGPGLLGADCGWVCAELLCPQGGPGSSGRVALRGRSAALQRGGRNGPSPALGGAESEALRPRERAARFRSSFGGGAWG